MDPVWFAIAGTFGGMFVLKLLQHRLTVKPNRVLSYADRWKNNNYVKMIHQTRLSEKEHFGEIITQCHCSSCESVKALPPTGPGSVSRRYASRPTYDSLMANGAVEIIMDNGVRRVISSTGAIFIFPPKE